ncbi:DUF1918 domain-containing protein [Saccharopolyspora sp. NPDC049426]|uniref:DUF1918 domain-containing protein n=1 Tax=Saccharopolyspora sp. NPDC049426 TaxID=3155652 RepID=UPI003413F04A
MRGPNGEPPFLVRWLADDYPSPFYPGPDAHREHGLPHHRTRGPAPARHRRGRLSLATRARGGPAVG